MNDKLSAARLWAATRMPYLASAVFACAVRPELGSGTIAIDRAWRVRADPDVVARLDVEQLGRLLVHLTAHVIRDHAGRGERLSAAPGQWNRCADAEINDDLGDLVPGVAGDLPETLGCERGKLAEAYYEVATPGPRMWDCGPGADGSPDDGDCAGGLDPRQAGLLRLAVAAAIQRFPGDVAAGWRRWAESVLPSRVDWRRVLAAEVRSALAAVSGQVDYSYRRPSRRASASPDVVLPTLHRPVPEVAIVCDTSGSMHDGLLARALAEVEGVLTRGGVRRARVLAVDTAVHAVRNVTRASQVELAGGGGTDMGAGLAAAAALKPRPTVTIVLTDGYTPWPDSPPAAMRVVVGLLSEGSPWPAPEWARVVVIEDE